MVSAQDGARLSRSIDRKLVGAALIANVVGALVVFGFLIVLAPGVDEPDIGRLLLINIPAFAVYLVAALIIGASVARRRFFFILARWLREERAATESERALVLGYPIRPAVRVSAAFWALAAIFFSLINVAVSSQLAAAILVTIPLGGVATCAVTYLLVERTMRPLTTRALAGNPPERPGALGIAGRVSVAWVAGTGVPVLGLIAIGIGNLLGFNLFGDDEVTLSGVTTFLALVALGAGLLSVYLAARSVADPLAAVRDGVQQVERGQLDARVAVDDASEVGLLEAGFNRMASGLQERERMRDLFGRHVGHDVAAAALASDAKLGGEERDVAAVFVDVIGSTRLAAERPAAEVVALLNAFFHVVVDVTEAHGGFVNKFEGDAALAVFGAPVSRADPAGDALAASREIRNRLHDKLAHLDVGVGVSAGRAVAGNVGAENRFEYTVIGDPINEAARLCELAKEHPQRVLASETALRRTHRAERNQWSVGDEVTLRGRREATRIATTTNAA